MSVDRVGLNIPASGAAFPVEVKAPVWNRDLETEWMIDGEVVGVGPRYVIQNEDEARTIRCRPIPRGTR